MPVPPTSPAALTHVDRTGNGAEGGTASP
ncbi:hypothetical protein BN9982_90047 [Mycobacterium tuberculosis]|nr:hypothetical protein BN9982_90047 [Mycobacterium tuberculosis]